MSRRARLISAALRRFEKPFLAREADPQRLRESFEQRARLLFHAPRDTVFDDRPLHADLPAWRILGLDTGVILYFHGGGYVFGSPRTHAAMVAKLARLADLSAVLPQYRLSPEHPFPAAFDDACRAWDSVLAEGWRPDQIILSGDSAGGGLALCLLSALCRQSKPLPRASVVFSPLTDMTFSGVSFSANAEADPLLPADRGQDVASFYLQGADPLDPRASPLFGTFSGASPVWMAVSATEILRDDTLRMALHLSEEGVEVETVLAPDLPHVWPIFHNMMPEAGQTLKDLSVWIRRQLARTDGS